MECTRAKVFLNLRKEFCATMLLWITEEPQKGVHAECMAHYG